MMTTLNEVKMVIPTATNVETYSVGHCGGIKVFYTGRAPMFKEDVKIGNHHYRWHYDEHHPDFGHVKVRLYMLIS